MGEMMDQILIKIKKSTNKKIQISFPEYDLCSYGLNFQPCEKAFYGANTGRTTKIFVRIKKM